MNFNHLKAFWAVAKYVSYSQAARELYVSQSTISIQVKKLEEELGVELFEQLGKKVYLTKAGEELYRYANTIFSLADESKRAIQEIRGLCAGRLIIGASTTPGIYLLPPIISSFQQKYPNVNISLEISNTHKVLERLLANELDLGIVGQELVNNQLHTELLLHDELVVIASSNHQLAQQSSISTGELANQRLILREPGSNTREVVEEKARLSGISLKASMQLSSVEAIKKAVAANLGVSVVSKLALELELSAGILKALSFRDQRLLRHINLTYHKGKKLMPAAREFIGFLKHVIAPGVDRFRYLND
ncbi:MAG TPA: selenium metabolism-associated LysR family transcriptional regulator [Anaerolineae bacterium]|nr:selenium metabolism-associated LysR family transcriptional regulator [Anaerolineae bacterium]